MHQNNANTGFNIYCDSSPRRQQDVKEKINNPDGPACVQEIIQIKQNFWPIVMSQIMSNEHFYFHLVTKSKTKYINKKYLPSKNNPQNSFFPLLILKVPIIDRLAGWEIVFLFFMPETVKNIY